MAATVAEPEPETAEKKVQLAIVTEPSPPGVRPKSMLTKRTIRGVQPCAISAPDSMNSGSATSAKEFSPSVIRSATMLSG